MSYLTFKLISLAVLVVLLLAVLIVRHNSKQETKQADSSTSFTNKHGFNNGSNETKVETPESICVFRFRNWWQRAKREDCKQMLISALVRFDRYLKDEDITDYDVQDRMIRLLDRLEEIQQKDIYPDTAKLVSYIRGGMRNDGSEMHDYFIKKYSEADLVDMTKYKYVMGYSLFDDPNAINHQNYSKLRNILVEMIKNSISGDIWRNIPLANEAIILMKKRGISVENEVYKEFCEMVVYEPMLDDTEAPRLMLSFIEYYHTLAGSSEQWEDKERKLKKMTDPNTSYKEICDLILEDHSLLYDPVQMTEKYEKVIYDVEKECNRLLKHEPHKMGFCHLYWSEKKKILAKHGIIWLSPSEMNPKVIID